MNQPSFLQTRGEEAGWAVWQRASGALHPNVLPAPHAPLTVYPGERLNAPLLLPLHVPCSVAGRSACDCTLGYVFKGTM